MDNAAPVQCLSPGDNAASLLISKRVTKLGRHHVTVVCRCLQYMINVARLCQYIVEQDLLGLVCLPFNVVDSTPRQDVLPTLM